MTGSKYGLLVAIAVLVLVLRPVGPATNPHAAARPSAPVAESVLHPRFADFSGRAPTPDVRYLANWVADSRDNGSAPFAILDKQDARVYMFDSTARLIDASPVLLGFAPGDDSVVGIGTRPIDQIRPAERTTPAGRFTSAPGRNATGEDIVWIDYEDAVSMHRVRPINPKERRLERLASPNPADRRISYGCVNVPVAFYNRVIHPQLGTRRAVVYVLPETKPLRAVFVSSYEPAEQGRKRIAAAPPLR